jgi:hypothetical protein
MCLQWNRLFPAVQFYHPALQLVWVFADAQVGVRRDIDCWYLELRLVETPARRDRQGFVQGELVSGEALDCTDEALCRSQLPETTLNIGELCCLSMFRRPPFPKIEK